MSLKVSYEFISYQPYSYDPDKIDKKKCLQNYIQIKCLMVSRGWKFIQRNLIDFYGEKAGHELWEGRVQCIKVSYPYVVEEEFSNLQKIIS